MTEPHEPGAGVFEANLGALLQRAYVPALPSEEFRSRAEAVLLAALPATSVRRLGGARRLTLLRPAVAAAAVLLAVTAGWWLLATANTAATADTLLARGFVAVRETPRSRWHALTPDEGVARGQLAGNFLEFATPDGAAFALQLPPADSVLGRPASAGSVVQLEAAADDAPALIADLQAGGLRLDHADAHASWLLRTLAGQLVLRHGSLEVACLPDGGVSAELHAGSAFLIGRHGPVELAAGVRVLIADGELRPGTADDSGSAAEPKFPDPGTRRPPEPLVSPSAGEGSLEPRVPPASIEAPVPLELAGCVTDAATGAPVPAFRVSIVRDRSVADANEPISRDLNAVDGRFAWKDLEADTWALYVHADGYAVASRGGLTLKPDVALPPLMIALERGVAVRGSVVDAASGEPITGAVVLSETDSPMRNLPLDAADFPAELTAFTRTAADGAFELSPLGTGQQVLRVTASGFAPQWTERFPVQAGAPVEGLLFRMQPGAGVAGRVTRADGQPWPNAAVLAWHSDSSGRRATVSYGIGVTNAEGRYAIADLSSGPAQVLMLGEAGSLAADQPPQMLAAQLENGNVTTVDFLGTGNGSLRGIVLDSQEQRSPPLGISVVRQDVSPEEAQATWRGTVSTPDGAFEIADLKPGAYEVYVGQPAGGSLCRYGAVSLPIPGGAGLTVRLPAGRIAGKLTARADGSPVRSTFVMLEREDDVAKASGGRDFHFAGYTMDSHDGSYAIEHVLDGHYRVTVYDTSGSLCQERSDVISVLGGVTTGITDLSLQAGGSVAVLVRRAGGEPVAGAQVLFKDSEGNEVGFDRDQRTGADGRYVAHGVRPGRWIVAAQMAGLQRAEQSIDVQVGVEQQAALQLVPQR